MTRRQAVTFHLLRYFCSLVTDDRLRDQWCAKDSSLTSPSTIQAGSQQSPLVKQRNLNRCSNLLETLFNSHSGRTSRSTTHGPSFMLSTGTTTEGEPPCTCCDRPAGLETHVKVGHYHASKTNPPLSHDADELPPNSHSRMTFNPSFSLPSMFSAGTLTFLNVTYAVPADPL